MSKRILDKDLWEYAKRSVFNTIKSRYEGPYTDNPEEDTRLANIYSDYISNNPAIHEKGRNAYLAECFKYYRRLGGRYVGEEQKKAPSVPEKPVIKVDYKPKLDLSTETGRKIYELYLKSLEEEEKEKKKEKPDEEPPFQQGTLF